MKKAVPLLPVISFVSVSYTVAAEGDFMSSESNSILAYSLVTGIFIGVSVDVAYVMGPFTGFEYLADSPVVPGIILSSSLLQIVSSITFSYIFTNSFIKWELDPLLSLPAGVAEGAVMGGISGGLTMALIFAIAVPTGAIVMNNSYSWIDTWYEGALQGFLGGFIYGMIPGAILGAAGAPAISYVIKK